MFNLPKSKRRKEREVNAQWIGIHGLRSEAENARWATEYIKNTNYQINMHLKRGEISKAEAVELKERLLKFIESKQTQSAQNRRKIEQQVDDMMRNQFTLRMEKQYDKMKTSAKKLANSVKTGAKAWKGLF